MKRNGKLAARLVAPVLVIGGGSLAIVMIARAFLLDGLAGPIEELPPGLLPAGQAVEIGGEALAQLSAAFLRRQDIYLTAIGLLMFMLGLTYYVATRLRKYFKETGAGIERLLTPGDAPIALSQELQFVQRKLNRVQSELARRGQEAKDAERRKDELVAYLAHDIRTPLTTLMGYLNLLGERPDLSPQQRAQYLGLAIASAARLDGLVSEFFEITSYNARDMALDAAPLDLMVLLGQLADEFYPMLEPSGKAIAIAGPASAPIVGDADKLARAFRNVIKNAAAYSDGGTAIQARVAVDGGTATVAISDTGAPIPPQYLDAIFDKFYRLDSARGAKTGGAGLGLAIAKEIVKAHGGAIRATSQGRTTTVTVTLPVA